MIAVEVAGGLGNQMYCYALYRTLLERGRDAYMDLSFYDNQNSPDIPVREYELGKVFNVKERILSKKEAFYMRLRSKFFLVKKYRDKEACFQPEVLNLEDGILSGCWQSFRYSQEIEGILREEFTFRKPLTGEAAQLISEVRDCNSVSVSVRRGDYVTLGHVLPVEYYERAVQYVTQKIPDAKFFCVSDDINWCKETFRDYDFTFVDRPVNDMQLISECKHNILANSTFAIWGAWLNMNANKIVTRPSRYFFSSKPKYAALNNRKDFWPDDWVRIEI